MSYVIGIDLGGSKIALGLLSPQQEILARRRINTEQQRGLADVIERIAVQIEGLAADLPAGARLSAVGICAPGPLDHISGDLLTLVNLPGLSNTPFRRALQQRLQLPVRLDHDAKVAALGEFYFGLGRARESMVYIVIGTGVGAAIIVEGRLLYGDGNSAGEVGHMTTDPSGQLCHCGSRGCLEAYASGPSLAQRYAGATGEHIDGAELAQRARAGDASAGRIFEEAGRALGIVIASLAMSVNIEEYVIGGSVAQSADLLLPPARATVPRYAFPAVADRVRVSASALGEDAPILGAGWMARQARAPS